MKKEISFMIIDLIKTIHDFGVAIEVYKREFIILAIAISFFVTSNNNKLVLRHPGGLTVATSITVIHPRHLNRNDEEQ